MLNKIIGFSIRNKLLIGLLMVGLIAWGAYSFTRLPIDAVPDITNNQVLVITTSPSLGAGDIERLITAPVEKATRNIPGMIEQRSFSRFGLSVITLVFDDQTDVYWARQQVNERLLQVRDQIPPGLGTPTMGPVTTGLGEIFQYVLKPLPGYEKSFSAMELRTIQDWMVRPQLLGTTGVADVSSFGGKLKQYEVAINDRQLEAYHLTIQDVFNALEKNNQNTGGAYIEKGPAMLFIRSEGLIKNIADLEQIAVTTLPSGAPVLLRDVAELKLGAATRYGALTYNDKGEVAGGVVMMLKGENSSQVIKEVKERIAQIQKSLPKGVVIEAFLDRTKMVNNAISTVEKNLAEGSLIVVCILVLFLGYLRAGLLVASVIPLSMLFAISMMNLFGVSGNLMSLGALDFGLIVDGAVIIVEAVMHRLHHKRHTLGQAYVSQEQMDKEVEQSAGKMMSAAVFGQIIILIVYLPILSLQGIEGKMFKPMAQTVAFAILGAFLLSLTYVPMMSTLVLSRKISDKKTFADRMMGVLERLYSKTLELVIRFQKTVLLSSAAVFVVAVVILLNMGGEFIPKLEEGDFAVDTRVLTGSSLTTSIEYTQQAAHVLLTQFPEVQKVVTKIGSGEIPTDPMPVEAADMMVILKPKSEWTSAKTFDELAEKMSKALETVPGITTGFQFPVQMRFNELMTGGRQDVVCKIFGDNLDSLTVYANRLGNEISHIEGAKDLYIETVSGLPQLMVTYKRDALAQYGLSVEEVNKTLNAAFAGAVAGQVFEGERRFDLVVRLKDQLRSNADEVKNLLIPTAQGQQVPLQQLATVEIQTGPNQIQRENAQRRISVGFNVRGRDVQTVVEELQGKANAGMKLPTGYFITYGGAFENLVAAKQRLAFAVPVALLLIFVLLYFAFNSISQSALIFSAIPLSAIGGVFALWSRGMPFSISAGVGFIALFGVAVLNGIVLITEFNLLKEAGMHDIRERIFKGTRIRLRPVLMTAAVASLGFLPMAISSGAGAEVQRPLATVVIGGLVTATALTLLVLPLLYAWLERRGQKKNKGIAQGSIVAVIALLVLATTGLQAQAPISLEEALQKAQQQNLRVQAANLRTQSAKKAEGTAWELPNTEALAEYGQVNSVLNDTRFSVSQGFAFPLVYVRQKQWLGTQTQSERINEQVVWSETKQRITGIYYEMLLMNERRKLLQQMDSMYTLFMNRQQERFTAGDANILEKASAEAEQLQANQQLQQLEADYRMLQQQLSRLLNTDTLYSPQALPLQLALNQLPDTQSVDHLPALKWRQQQQQVASAQLKVNKARMSPNFVLAYTNQSINGLMNVKGVETNYGMADRFQSVTAGITVPLFFNAGLARTKAAQLQLKQVQTEYADARLEAQTNLLNLWQQLEKHKQTLKYYESGALKLAQTLQSNALLQLQSGHIGYLEWFNLMHQSVTLQSGYLNAIGAWNETVLALQPYLTNN